ncbi:MAG: hypothetical protein ACI311_03260 [Bacilli bacterium]
MMKTLKKLFPFVFLVILIIFSSISSLIFVKVQHLFETFFFSLIPLLAPTILFDCLFVNSGGLDTLCEICKNKSNIFIKIIILIIGIIGGSASLSFYINYLIKRNILTIKEGQSMLNHFFLPSLPFVINIILVKLEGYLKILFVLLLYIVPFFIYTTLNIKEPKNIASLEDNMIENNSFNFLANSIYQAGKTMVVICGTIILYNIPYYTIIHLFNLDDYYEIQGLIEFSNALINLSNNLTIKNICSIMFILSFSSFSTYSQTHIMVEKINILLLIKKRLLLAFINTFIILLFLLNI